MQLSLYHEPLEADELAFLQRKEQRERKDFYKVIKWIMILCFICPFVVAWFRAIGGVENAFSYTTYFAGVGFLFCFAGAGIYFAYKRTLYHIQADIKKQTKTIEHTHIIEKKYMPHNNTYHFYLDSPNKLSIEVKEQDYSQMREGDELNIEYTTYSKQYLGYF